MHAIIDIGSNTIRLSIYKCSKKQFKILFHKKEMAGLAGYVKDGKLSDVGIHKACDVLKEFQGIISNMNVKDVLAFATASLRNISNTKEAIDCIAKMTGFQVEVITGEEEARLDFIGAMHNVDISDGLLIDIGGGSTEVVPFRDRSTLDTVSIPIGSLSLYAAHVKKILPKKEEIQKMADAVKISLDQNVNHSIIVGRQKICGVGGTIRALLKLCNYLYHKESDNTCMTGEEIKELYELLCNKKTEKWKAVLKICPDRIHTIIPGLTILETVVEQYNAAEIVISQYGVREGYLVSRIMSATSE